ncbi:tetratricopeptide repeat protein [Kordiimonas aestuarii]|uniref:tetratricopeptide repeat protein n=1 Tax=Kordiimonas aestuarii TaxID=1005925 RepID=UPI0021D21C56|nr:tetratricopeptide repeat protein [Kordiimonas aestuarii]
MAPAQDNHECVEHGLADSAFAHGKLSDALRYLQAAIAIDPDNFQLLLKKASVLQALYRDHDAASVLDDARALAPNDISVRLARAQLATALGDQKLANYLYNSNLALTPYHPGTLIARIDTALATQMNGPAARALASNTRAILETALKDNPERQTEYQQALGDLAFRMRDWETALSHWRAIGLDDGCFSRRTFQIAQCHLFLLEDTHARRIIDMALGINPDSVPALQLLSELEMSIGHTGKSIEIRKHLFATEGLHRVPVGVRLAQDFLLLGCRDQAADMQLQCATLSHERLEVGFVRLLMNQERAQEAWDYAIAWQDCIEQSSLISRLFQDLCQIIDCPESIGIRDRLSRLSDNKEAGLFRAPAEVRDIFFSLEPAPSDVMQGRQYLRFAWERRKQSGISYKDWQDKTFRATSANHYLTPVPKVSAQEVAQLTVAADFDILKPYIGKDRPVLFACSHQGPYMQHLISLYFNRFRFATLGHTNDDAGNLDDRNFPLQGGREGAAIGLVKALRRGEAVILPVDNGSLSFAAKKTNGAKGKLFGIPISIPDTIPRLAQEFSIPSFWIYSNWQDGQLRYDILRLPDPFEGETRQEWHNRWAGAYLQHLEAAMSGEPQNVNITAPLWRQLLLNSGK